MLVCVTLHIQLCMPTLNQVWCLVRPEGVCAGCCAPRPVLAELTVLRALHVPAVALACMLLWAGGPCRGCYVCMAL
jgi:hypothetical protein